MKNTNKVIPEPDTCIICLENLGTNYRIISNNCSCLTLAHDICVETYRSKFNICPFCRKKLNNTIIISVQNNITNNIIVNVPNNQSNNKNKYIVLLLNFLLVLFHLNPIITMVIINYYQNMMLLNDYNHNKLEQPDNKNIDETYNNMTMWLSYTIFLNITLMILTSYSTLFSFYCANNQIKIKIYNRFNDDTTRLFIAKFIVDIIFNIFISILAQNTLIGGSLNIIDAFGRLISMIIIIIFTQISYNVYEKIRQINSRHRGRS
jgi:hypothetical protein